MAKTLVRKLLVPFGINGNSTYFAQFGSLVAGAALKTKDIPTIQSLPAWSDGLQEAVYGANKAPLLSDMNSLFYVLGYQLAYVLQEGIPEWDSQTTYYAGSYVRRPGTYEIYGSVNDNNLNNALPVLVSNSQWRYMTFMGVEKAPTGSVLDNAIVTVSGSKLTGSLPAGYVTDANIISLSAPKVSGQLTDAQIVSLSTSKLIGQVSDSQISGVSASKVSGQVGTSQIADGSVTSAKLAAGAAPRIGNVNIPAAVVTQDNGLVTIANVNGSGILIGVGHDSGGNSGGSSAGTLNYTVIVDGVTYTVSAGNGNGANFKYAFSFSRGGLVLTGLPGFPQMFRSNLQLKAQVTGASDGRSGATFYVVYQLAS